MLATVALLPLALQLPSSPGRTAPAPAPSTPSCQLGRRTLLEGAGAALALGLPGSAHADVRGANSGMPTNEKDVNKFLVQQGFAKMAVPGGFSPLVEYIGTAPPANIDGQKVKDRGFSNTLLVRFVYPNGWLVEAPSITENGEAGDIGANNYIKGDSAKFAAVRLPSGASITSLEKDKEFFKGFLSSQMSNDVYEDIKIKKIRPVTQADGTEMLKVDFAYTLLTRAGFTVLRQGMAAASVVDGSCVGLVAATTQLRFKELSSSLETTIDSFRAYTVKTPAFGPDSVI